jgi:hypothetical protein
VKPAIRLSTRPLAGRMAAAALLVIALGLPAGCGTDSGGSRIVKPDDPIVENRPPDPGVSFELPCPLGDFDAEFLFGGGPPPDGIPSLDNPPFVSADDAGFLRSDDRVIGVELDGRARAYPKKILHFHEIVNQCIGDKQTALTYCPLTNTAVHYSTGWSCGVSGNRRFGTSGLLYMGNLVMYDAPTNKLWPQIFGDAVTSTGGFAGQCLETLYCVETSWEVWKKLHPSTLVLSPDNGSGRNYNYNPYKSFWDNPNEPWFVTPGMSRRIQTTLPYKDMVLGVITPAARKAFKLPDGMYVINDTVGGIPVTIFSDGATQSFFVFERVIEGRELTFDLAYIAEGDDLPVFKDRETLSEWTLDGIAFEGEMKGARLPLMPSMRAFWYAWSLFFPDTELQIVPQPG